VLENTFVSTARGVAVILAAASAASRDRIVPGRNVRQNVVDVCSGPLVSDGVLVTVIVMASTSSARLFWISITAADSD
jgi:hypothetical protein